MRLGNDFERSVELISFSQCPISKDYKSKLKYIVK